MEALTPLYRAIITFGCCFFSTNHVRELVYMTFPALTIGYIFFCACRPLVTYFPAVKTCRRLHIFPCSRKITCFPALVAGHIYFRVRHWLYAFPMLPLITCFMFPCLVLFAICVRDNRSNSKLSPLNLHLPPFSFCFPFVSPVVTSVHRTLDTLKTRHPFII